jgi:hypothetical protein
VDAVELKPQSDSESKPRLNTEPRMAHLAFRMPANSNAVGAKKPRKKPCPPQVIAPEVWVAVEKAVCAGMGYSQAARAFGIRSPHAIIMRSRRDKWPVPSRVEERARQLQASLQRSREAAEQRRNGNDTTTQSLAASWAERGEVHRAVAFDFAHNSLKAAAKAGLPVASWRDASLADAVARKSAGLDSKEGSRIQIGLALIETRLQAINLPKDAAET